MCQIRTQKFDDGGTYVHLYSLNEVWLQIQQVPLPISYYCFVLHDVELLINERQNNIYGCSASVQWHTQICVPVFASLSAKESEAPKLTNSLVISKLKCTHTITYYEYHKINC